MKHNYPKPDHQNIEEWDCDFEEKQIIEHKAGIAKPYPTKRVRTKEDLLPLSIRMMRDYARSKAVNDDQIYYKLKSRERELAQSKFQNHQGLGQSRQSSKYKSIGLSRSKKVSEVGLQPEPCKNSLEGIVIQSNEYFHRVNQSVMNRLLGIIEHNQARNSLEVAVARENSTHPHSLAESRHIVINNILPKKEQSQTSSLITSKMRYTEEKVQKLYSQRKHFSYATPQTIKDNSQANQNQKKVGQSSIHREMKFEFSENQDLLNHNQRSQLAQEDIYITEVTKHNNKQRRERQFKKERKICNQKQNNPTNETFHIDHCQRLQVQDEQFSQPTYRTQQNTKGIEEQPLTHRTDVQARKHQNSNKGIMGRFDGQQRDASSQISFQISQNVDRLAPEQKKEEYQKKAPVFIQIPINDGEPTMSLAEAFKKRVGKLPSQSMPKKERKIRQDVSVSPLQRNGLKKTKNKKENIASLNSNEHSCKSNFHLGDLNCSITKSIQGGSSAFVTPKSSEPSEDLLNRLIGGSKAKISKKEMYALTKKNYENLPEVREKKKQEKKKQLEKERMERIKEYQKSIRTSKTTISSLQ